MPASLLGLLMLVCPGDCALPLPGGALELHAAAPGRQWCLRVDAPAPWRLCDDQWPAWWRATLDDMARRLGSRSASASR